MNGNQFDGKRRIFGAIAGPVLAIILWWLPIETLTEEAHHLLAIMSLVARLVDNGTCGNSRYIPSGSHPLCHHWRGSDG